MRLLEYFLLGLRHRKDPLYVKYLAGKRVLDVGCGLGEFLARDPANTVGADLDPELVSRCRERGLAAHCMSALQLEFPDASFDAVHAAQLIEHFAPLDAVRFLAEAERLLRPGGYVFLTTPGVRNVWNTFSHVRPYPPAAFGKLLASATESYICDGKPNLALELVQGHRFYFEGRATTFLFSIVDLLFPPSDPIGWTIILRKPPSQQ